MEGKRTGRRGPEAGDPNVDSSPSQSASPRGGGMGEGTTGESGTARGRGTGAGGGKTAAGRGATKTARGRSTAGTRGSEANGFRRELRDFAAARPGGWGHEDWTRLLDQLRERGHDTSDPDRIGRDLERERLRIRLEKISGLGPARVKNLVEEFETLWSLRNAGVDEIASVQGINRSMAEKIKESLD